MQTWLKIACMALLLQYSNRAFAQNNPIPDLTFGIEGGSFYNTTIYWEHGKDLAIQPWDGKIVLAGTVSNPPILQGVVVRFNADGSLDTGFGENGIIRYLIPDATHTANSVLIQPDHSILVGGEFGELLEQNKTDLIIARFLENGQPDLSFGDGGSIILVHSDWSDYGGILVPQPDNKILVVGNTNNGTISKMALIRLLPNGSPDNSFGVDGALYAYYGQGAYCAAYNAVWQNGKIVVVGEVTPGNGDLQSLVLVRYDSSGALDTSFGTGGVSILNTSEYLDYGTDILALPDGKLLVSGGNSTLKLIFVARITENGAFDTSFGTNNNGYSYLETCCFSGGANMVLQPDNKILLASHTNDIYGLVRFSSNGILDEQFGLGGIYRGYNYGLRSSDGVGNLAFQSDGRLVVGGTAGSFDADGQQGLAVARFDMDIIMETQQQGPFGAGIQAIPNPFHETCRLKWPAPNDGLVKICMLDISGKTVWQTEKSSSNAESELLEIHSALEPGIYFIQVANAERLHTIKVVKQ